MNAAGRFSDVAGPDAGSLLTVTVDALVNGVHFPRDTGVADVAFKSLAVNLSDLAAMGAEPLSAQSVCESPAHDKAWREAVASAMKHEARIAFGIGFDTACNDGPERRVVVQAMGQVPRGLALTRNGARPGHQLWVSGTPGDAGAGLAIAQGRLDAGDGAAYLRARLDRPQPRSALGVALRGIASSMLDVSDGIAGDASHLARGSGVSLHIEQHRIPISDILSRMVGEDAARTYATFAGDDYELLFTAPCEQHDAVLQAGETSNTTVNCIGHAAEGERVRIINAHGEDVAGTSYEHFRVSG